VVAKISIVPRGPAGGVTIFMPSEDRLNSGLYSKEFLENRMCVALGGRLAEEIINGKDNVTTGASNDFQQCTQVAEAMVKQLGMSDIVGQRVIGGQEGGGGPFMGRDFMGGGAPPVSQSLRQKIDAEVRRIVDEQYERGMKLLSSNMTLLHSLAEKLMDQEKVSGEELMKLVNETAAQGKLTLAAAAYTGELASSEGESSDDDMLAAAALVSRRRRNPKTTAKTTGDGVFAQVSEMAKEATKAELPASTLRSVTAQVLAAMAATSMPFQAYADTAQVPPPGSPVSQQQPADQQQQRQQQQREPAVQASSSRHPYH